MLTDSVANGTESLPGPDARETRWLTGTGAEENGTLVDSEARKTGKVTGSDLESDWRRALTVWGLICGPNLSLLTEDANC